MAGPITIDVAVRVSRTPLVKPQAALPQRQRIVSEQRPSASYGGEP